jgi:hypothetical protein
MVLTSFIVDQLLLVSNGGACAAVDSAATGRPSQPIVGVGDSEFEVKTGR